MYHGYGTHGTRQGSCVCCLAQNLAMPTAQSNATNNTAVPQPLAGAINSTFGSLTTLKANMTAAGLGVFGSGEHAGYLSGCRITRCCLAACTRRVDVRSMPACKRKGVPG